MGGFLLQLLTQQFQGAFGRSIGNEECKVEETGCFFALLQITTILFENPKAAILKTHDSCISIANIDTNLFDPFQAWWAFPLRLSLNGLRDLSNKSIKDNHTCTSL